MEDSQLAKVERIKGILVARATGMQADDAEYTALRRDLIGDKLVSEHLPRCVHQCRNMGEFWAFIQPKFARYRERRLFLQEQFDPLLTLLEKGGSGAPSAKKEECVPKLFISHAIHDREVVEKLVDLIESGVGVPADAIFCSSLKGQSIRPGEDFVASIRDQLDAATCVLALISEAYYASSFSLCELGGVWLQCKSFIPILVPPVDHAGLKAVLGGLQVNKIDQILDLDEMRDELVNRLSLKHTPTARWTKKRDAFIELLPAILERSPYLAAVPRDVHDKLKGRLAEQERECKEAKSQQGKLEVAIAELKKTKDAKQVEKIMGEPSTADAFKMRVTRTKEALKPLSRGVRQALFYYVRGENYQPKGEDECDDAHRLVEDGQLRSEGDGSYSPRDTNGKIRKAMDWLEEFTEWLESPPEPPFFEWYQEQADGEEPNITLRPFWKRNF